MSLFAYVDESGGRDPKKPGFVVAIVVCDEPAREELERRLALLEKRSRKGAAKWTHTLPTQRREYLQGLSR